jgi:hypothetical protein
MAASDYVPNLSKNRLHPKGCPQMGSGRSRFAISVVGLDPSAADSDLICTVLIAGLDLTQPFFP